MIRAVLDTNILASGFLRSKTDSAVVQILDAWRADIYTLIVSEHILAEIAATFDDPYFATRLTIAQRAADLALLREEASLIPITAEIHDVATHPEDDLVIATAVSARADYLVTGDRHLQALRTYQEIAIISARQFADILHSQSRKDVELL